MNPLLNDFATPYDCIPFDKIETEHFLPALKESIEKAYGELSSLKKSSEPSSFQNTIVMLEKISRRIGLISSAFSNLHAFKSDDKMREVAKEFFPLLTEYRNNIHMDQEIFSKVQSVYEQDHSPFSLEEKALLEKLYLSFVRDGALLEEESKRRLREINKELQILSLKFGENVLHATNEYTLHLTKEEDVKGLPQNVLGAAEKVARDKGKEGWIFTLHAPSCIPFLKFADNRELREEMFRARRCLAYQDEKYDNAPVVRKMTTLRAEKADLLGYPNYAAYILETRMLDKVDKVYSFMDELLDAAKPTADRETQELEDLQFELTEKRDLQRWDYSYYSEKLRKEKFSFDESTLRPYFPLEQVLDGIFTVAHRLYSLNFEKAEGIPTYHSEVQTYKVIHSESNDLVGLVYLDLFPRKEKRSGAWMNPVRSQYREEGKDYRPHIMIGANFTRSVGENPALLALHEVRTLFHEFGHCLHGLLSQCQYQMVSGLHVAWDFVELPSKLQEKWIWQKECLDLFASHYETGEKISPDLLHKIQESVNFGKGHLTVTSLALCYLDMAWHTQPETEMRMEEFEAKVIDKAILLPTLDPGSRSCSFAHIFNGGYAAGYYSYLWSESLAADAFELFQENGIFDSDTAERFRKNVLSRGATEKPMALYTKFRGKEPSVQALLKSSGFAAAS